MFGLKELTRGFASVLLTLVFLAGTTALARDLAGQVILATGAVSAIGTDGQLRVLAKGSIVYPGDRITTASKSLCVLKMIDDAKMTIRADSELIIEEYSFEGTEDDSSVMELVKGGFRTLTGAIGSNNPDAYRVNSDLSVLGIRGTDYSTQLLLELKAAGFEPGQFTHVDEGGVFIEQNGNILNIKTGEIAFAGPSGLKKIDRLPDSIANEPTPSPADIPDTATPLTGMEGCRL